MPHQSRHFHARLNEAENIVDEQQHIATLVVAEIFGHRQRRVDDPEAGAGRFVHLSKHHHHIRQNIGRRHVAVKFLSLAAALSNAAKNTHAFLLFDEIVNHFGEQHGLAHARPPK